MESFSDSVPPHDPDADDIASVGSIALTALVPYFGPVLAGVLDRAVQKHADAAQNEFNLRIAQFLDQLAAAGRPITPEDVLGSDEFLAAVTKFSREAVESSSSAKRSRLAAAGANSGDWSEFALALRNQFAKLVIDLDDLHVFLLHYFMSPRDWLASRGLGVLYPKGRGGSPEDPLVQVFRTPQPAWGAPVRQAMADLNGFGLLEIDPDYATDDDRYLERATTPKGEKFLRYLAEDQSVGVDPPSLFSDDASL